MLENAYSYNNNNNDNNNNIDNNNNNSRIPGQHNIYNLQRSAILSTAQFLRKVLSIVPG